MYVQFTVLHPLSFFIVHLSEGESIGSASCESCASGKSQAYSQQGESYSHSQTTLPAMASVRLCTVFTLFRKNKLIS